MCSMKEILRGSFISLLAKVASAGITVIFTLVITRLLPSDEAGTFLFYLTIVLVSSNLSRLGVDKNIVKSLSGTEFGDKENEDNKYSTYLFSHIIPIFIISLIASILLFISTPILNSIFPDFNINQVSLGFFAIPFYSLCLLIANFYQVKSKAYIFILALNFFQQSSTLLMIGVFWLLGYEISIHVIVLAYFLGCMISALVLIFYSIKLVKNHRKPTLDLATFVNSIRLSIPLFIVVIFNLVVNWSTQFILAMFNSPEDLSVYTVCLRLVMLISFILVAVNSVTAPKYARFFKNNDINSVRAVYGFSLKISFAFSLCVTLFYLFSGKYLLAAFGANYSGAHIYLIIMMVGQILNVMCGSVAYILQMKGDYIKVMKANIFAALTSILISFYLIQYLGLLGATISYSLSIGILNLILLAYVMNIFKTHYKREE